jgi:hypothetical protein
MTKPLPVDFSQLNQIETPRVKPKSFTVHYKPISSEAIEKVRLIPGIGFWAI